MINWLKMIKIMIIIRIKSSIIAALGPIFPLFFTGPESQVNPQENHPQMISTLHVDIKKQ